MHYTTTCLHVYAYNTQSQVVANQPYDEVVNVDTDDNSPTNSRQRRIAANSDVNSSIDASSPIHQAGTYPSPSHTHALSLSLLSFRLSRSLSSAFVSLSFVL